jgi:hypothetical protein
MSNPSNAPLGVTTPKPVKLSLTPHLSTPLSRTASRVFPSELPPSLAVSPAHAKEKTTKETNPNKTKKDLNLFILPPSKKY